MKKQNLKKGIAKVGYAMVTNESEYTYGEVKWLESEVSGGREYTAEPNGEPQEIYADSITVFAAEENNGYDLTLILLAIIDEIEKEWLNHSEISTGGILETANSSTRPRFALFLVEETTNGIGQTTIYFNCFVSKRPKSSGKTSEGKFEAQYPEFSISARPRPTDKWVRATLPQSKLFDTIPEIALAGETPEPTQQAQQTEGEE